ncbi:zf-HC2 domain-containing protein [Terracidiphilus gabretensis]|jgi:Putative zinc-finger|uniref:zf-HC2 domain-containing protein n=1 Tax=Terracidiphilus gabretensis TaxID=1577687 RepID=UPI00071BF0D2|nr:zf-HC2 domain-containing protein [Terracidiphilus gabretensis]
MNGCSAMQAKFSEYLDGRLTGVEMQRISSHLDQCLHCSAEWTSLRNLQSSLSALGSMQEPDDLLLRIRVAVSQERARSRQSRFQWLSLTWKNTVGPFLLQASAGFASAVLLLGTVAVMVGIVSNPPMAQAGDEPLGNSTAPRLLYSIGGSGNNDIAALSGPVVVEAYVNGQGSVYDFRIVSGPNDSQTRAAVQNLLLVSKFEPARFFGQPVRGLAVLSFSGVSVRG